MDQIKIGKFIATERKNKKLTQRQLADILEISDKTISKWERGNGFPEVSLLLPLCNELQITVNELLSAERISELDYKKKAEANMVNIILEKEENRKKMQLTALVGIISTISFITLLMVVCIYTEFISLPVKLILIIIACCIFITGLYVAMQGERTIGYYQCKHCGKAFVPTLAAYTMGIHMITVRRLKCPCCSQTSWCKKILSKNQEC